MEFGKRFLVVIEGEAGVGKSRLVQEIKTFEQGLSGSSLYGVADLPEKTTPYFVFRNIFRQMFIKLQYQHSFSVSDVRKSKQIDQPISAYLTFCVIMFFSDNLQNEAASAVQSVFRTMRSAKRKDKVQGVWDNLRKGNIKWKYVRLVQSLDPELVQYLPLINQLLFLDIPENNYTILLSGEERATQTKDYLIKLMSLFEQRMGQLAVIIEVLYMTTHDNWIGCTMVGQRLLEFDLLDAGENSLSYLCVDSPSKFTSSSIVAKTDVTLVCYTSAAFTVFR